ncbi:MAG TPA: type II toxin-antitoxin system Phd/YefM family antitoxin [Anaerolineales bacterium]|nr:type II toxin-antitoxin system Phd/YefM family antitoxin [Anaerolineales bacterium]
MNIAPLADVKARFSAYIKKIQEGPVIITKHGKPVAVLLSISDEDDLERVLLANSVKFQALLDAAEERIRKTGGISHEALWTAVESEAK